jgi:hypothetical protein
MAGLGCVWCAFTWAGRAAALVVIAAGALGIGVEVEVEEVEDAEPHALTASVSTTAAPGMRRSLIAVSLPPCWWLVSEDAQWCGLLPAVCEGWVKGTGRI